MIPYYCPNCGIPIRGDMNDMGDDSNRFPIENKQSDGGYDVYCPECEWSGDIYPDDEINEIVEKTNKNINEMKRQEFYDLPNIKWDEDIGKFDSLIILPKKEFHESGYRLMDFVAVIDNMPICRLSGCSDVLYIDEINGGGRCRAQELVKPKGWKIDCLKESGLLRLFGRGYLTAGPALSSFKVYCDKGEKYSLTTGEKLRIFSSKLSNISKYMIRYERHGNYNTPGGIEDE